MKKLYALLLLLPFFFSCSDSDEVDQNLVASSEFTLPQNVQWTERLENNKVYIINSLKELNLLLKNEATAEVLDVDFETETLLLMHTITTRIEKKELKLFSEVTDKYTYEVTFHYGKGDIEMIGVEQYLAIKTAKLSSQAIVKLDIVDRKK